MRIILPALAAALVVAGAGSAHAVWDSLPPPSGPLMVGAWVSDAGGDAEPRFGPGGTVHATMAGMPDVVMTAQGDGYDVTPRAFLGEQREVPRAITVAER